MRPLIVRVRQAGTQPETAGIDDHIGVHQEILGATDVNIAVLATTVNEAFGVQGFR